MPEAPPGRDSLVLYKGRPARVQQLGKKLEIELEEGQILKVRPKDVVLLHPGPMQGLDDLQPQEGEVETAWELLAGETTTLRELAELAYVDYRPATAWAAWQLVEDGLYFHGTPEEVQARAAEGLAEERESRQARASQEQAKAAFLERVRMGQVLPADWSFLREVADLALGRTDKSRVLREIGFAETPESAHAMLLELGIWDHSIDPYPQRLGLPTSPPEVEVPDLPQETRVDLTHLSAWAIDDEGNQEPDDALSLEGGRLWVHVADVAALVTPDSTSDLEARARGASLYLPEGTVPMLPWPAAEQLGLGLAETSPALSFGLDLGAAGEIAGVEVVPSWVRVTRLTYEEAEARLEEEPFHSLYRVAELNRARREARGAVEIELPEVRMRVEGDQVRIQPLVPLRSRELVTEAMLMTGEAVGRFASEREIPIPFTVQDPPETEERPRDLAGMFGLRRYLKPSQQSTVPGSHAGLGLEVYVQATSPLRRYLDLVVHQQLRAHLRGEPPLEMQGILERIGATSAVAGSVRQAERLARRHWTLVYLMQHPGWRGDGVVVERRGRQGTVLLPALDLDVRMHLRPSLELNSQVSLVPREVKLATLEAHFQVTG
jgi:exoribonuclease-2